MQLLTEGARRFRTSASDHLLRRGNSRTLRRSTTAKAAIKATKGMASQSGGADAGGGGPGTG